MKIYDCKVNHMIDPIGYQLDEPDFTWKVNGDVYDEDIARSRIIVKCNHEEIYDTRWKKHLDPLGTSLPIPLKPRTRYTWTVSVKTEEGLVTTGDEHFFETGKMDEEWKGKWITCKDQEETRHPVFHHSYSFNKKIRNARFYITALGLYEAKINGKKITEEYLTPYCNDYESYLQVQTYDVTKLLKKESRIEVMLGNGWYRGRFGFDQNEKPAYGSAWAMLCELHVQYEDGSEDVYGSDETWKVTRSNITFSNIYDGEHIDLNLEETKEEDVILYEEETSPVRDRVSLPVLRHEMFKGTLIHTPKDETVIDIGQNLAGVFSLKIHEAKGTKIRLQFGEVLQDGCFYRDNLRTAKAEYIIISDGKEHVIEPHFTFYGFRYVKIEGCSNFEKDDFKAYAIYSDLHDFSTLTTGNELVNKLIKCAEWGMKSNYADVPTDCPQRDERMGWTGDAQVFSRTAMYLCDPYAFMHKYLYDMSQEQKKMDGAVPFTVPSFHIHQSATVWGDACTIIPWNEYEFSGDIRILKDQYASMKAWVDYMHEKESDNHGWTGQFHFGDWLALDGEKTPEAVKGLTDDHFIAAVYFRKSALIVSESAKLLGNREDEKYYKSLADEMEKYLKQEWFTPSGRCAMTSMTAMILCLKEGLGDTKIAKETLDKLLRFNNGKLATGFVGTPLFAPVLTEYGMEKQAYDLLLNEEYPGWLYEVKLGATTVWERWNSLDENGHITGVGMNSLNHYSYGSIVEWIYAYAAGLSAVKPGFKEARIAPNVHYALKEVDCTYPSASGTYRVSWKILDRYHMHMEWTIPYGCRATVYFPYYASSFSPLIFQIYEGMGSFEHGEYVIDYETNRPLDGTITMESLVPEALKNPKIREYLEEIPLFAQSEYSYTNSTVYEALNMCTLTEEQLNEIEEHIAQLQEQ